MSKIDCPECKGRGEHSCVCPKCGDDHYHECKECGGEGEIDEEDEEE